LKSSASKFNYEKPTNIYNFANLYVQEKKGIKHIEIKINSK
jgi:hypothetical protein